MPHCLQGLDSVRICANQFLFKFFFPLILCRDCERLTKLASRQVLVARYAFPYGCGTVWCSNETALCDVMLRSTGSSPGAQQRVISAGVTCTSSSSSEMAQLDDVCLSPGYFFSAVSHVTAVQRAFLLTDAFARV